MFIELTSAVDGLSMLVNVENICFVDDDKENRTIWMNGCYSTVKETYKEIYDKIRVAETIQR